MISFFYGDLAIYSIERVYTVFMMAGDTPLVNLQNRLC